MDGHESSTIDGMKGPTSNWEKPRQPTPSSDQSFTPLHIAAMNGDEDKVCTLLGPKADATAKTNKGLTPLHLSAQGGHLAITAALLKGNVSVSARDDLYLTPLHYATENGHKEIVELLIANGAKVNASDCKQFTPLHLASKHGHTDIMELLISKRANINAKCSEGATPLFGAAMFGHEEAAKCLIRNKCNVNASSRYATALHVAVLYKNMEIVRILLESGVKIGDALHMAVTVGYKDMVEMLLNAGANPNLTKNEEPPLIAAISKRRRDLASVLIKHGACVNYAKGMPLIKAVELGFTEIADALLINGARVKTRSFHGNDTLLHLAAQKGHQEVVKLLIRYGDDIEGLSDPAHMTPLAFAAAAGHKGVVEVLLAKGADANFQTDDGTALHIAAIRGHADVVKALLDNGMHPMTKDRTKKTALEHAVINNKFSVVDAILRCKRHALKEKNSEGNTMLQVATQLASMRKDRDFKMVRHLVSKGASVYAYSHGLKPIHVAAMHGTVELVDFFISHGQSINELCRKPRTPLYYAATTPNVDVVHYLVGKGADINVMDRDGQRPLLHAVTAGRRDLVELFLSMGATYQPAEFYSIPGAFDQLKDVVNVLVGTTTVFVAVENNYVPGLVDSIKKGGFLNAKNSKGSTPLTIAASERFQKITSVLLKNGADPNIADAAGMTPLHYAVQKSHIKIATMLLAHGAVYESLAKDGTPLDYAIDEDIVSLLKLIALAFKRVGSTNLKIIEDLKVIEDTEALRAVLGARNRQRDTLISLASRLGFSRLHELKILLADDEIQNVLKTNCQLLADFKFKEALAHCRASLEDKRTKLAKYGPHDLRALSIKTQICRTLYTISHYADALDEIVDLSRKQEQVLGPNDVETMVSVSMIGFIQHRRGANEEARSILQHTLEKQKVLMGEKDITTIYTKFYLAMTLLELGENEAALALSEAVFMFWLEKVGPAHPETISAQSNYALSLQKNGKAVEACAHLTEVLDTRLKAFGQHNTATCYTMNCLAGVLRDMGKLQEALDEYLKVADIQKEVLPFNHSEVFMTQYNIALTHMALGNNNVAYQIFSSIINPLKELYGLGSKYVVDVTERMLLLQPIVPENCVTDICTAAAKGNLKEVIRLAEEGRTNDVDSEGRTALHFAADKENLAVVESLLKHGADANIADRIGNTALHLATARSNTKIVGLLLESVSPQQRADYVNVMNRRGELALHIAAEKGSLSIVKLLLKNYAIVSIITNKGKTPLNLAKDAKVRKLLRTIQSLFRDVAAGKTESLKQLAERTPDDMEAITRARNEFKLNLSQVALAARVKAVEKNKKRDFVDAKTATG